MRIRKRRQSLRETADLPFIHASPAPPATTVAVGEEIVVAAEAPPPFRRSDQENRGGELHSYGQLPNRAFQGSPSAKEGVNDDLLQRRKVKQEGENGGDGRGGAGATALKSVGGESSEHSTGQDEDKTRLSTRRSRSAIQRPKSADNEEPEREGEELDLFEREPESKLGFAADKSKKRRSPAVLMEGSRCSRVNGRGWRCCQQTLVGYSLCEHHLGKGRLRSVNSVKCNERVKRSDEELESEEKTTSTTEKKKKKRKVGTVKARSISSLLHQTQVSPAAPPSSPVVVSAMQ